MNTHIPLVVVLCAGLVAAGCRDDSRTRYSRADADLDTSRDVTIDTPTEDAPADLPPDIEPDVIEDTATTCVPSDGCIFDYTCSLRTGAFPFCTEGVCVGEIECPDGMCECAEDFDCIDGSYCELGVCRVATCDSDCECGEGAWCAPDGICRSCRATCVDDTSCAPLDSCQPFGYELSCSECVTCPPEPNGSSLATTTLLRSPEDYLGQDVNVFGILMTAPGITCDDLGPCGMCYPQLALDGIIPLRGNEGAAGLLCGELVGCREERDTCLPRWSCHPAPIGSFVKLGGTFERIGDGDDDRPWYRILDHYRLAVDSATVVTAPPPVGLYEGTLRPAIDGTDCPKMADEFAIEMVLAMTADGYALEFMAGDEDGFIPVASGWHAELDGIVGEGSLVASPGSPLVRFDGDLHVGGITGTYYFSFSGRDCRIESDVELALQP